MTAASPLTSVEALLTALEKSGVVPPAGLATVRETAAKAADPKQLARELIKDGTLTKWQAGQLLHNYHALLVGKYELLDQLGAGELGRVYLVEQVDTKQRYALKVLSKKHTSDSGLVKGFLAEAQRARKLQHRNLARIEEIHHDNERCNVLAEYVEGQDLQRMVEGGGPLTISQALELIRQAAEGLAYAHERGVIHGNLKPSNLAQDATGTVKILDFAQASLKPLSGEAKLDPATDLFSLGSVLCYLISGKPATNSAEVSERLSDAPDVTEEVQSLCCKLMADSPDERPASMQELLTQLDLAIWQASTSSAKVESSNDSRSFYDEDIQPIAAEPKPSEMQPAIAKQSSEPGRMAPAQGAKIAATDRAAPLVESSSASDAPTVSLVSSVESSSVESVNPEPGEVNATAQAPSRTLTMVAIGAGGVLLLCSVLVIGMVVRARSKPNVVVTTSLTAPLIAADTAVADAMPEITSVEVAEPVAAASESQSTLPVTSPPPAEVASAPVAPPPPVTPAVGDAAPSVKPAEAPPAAAKAATKAEAKPPAKPASPPKPAPKPNPFQGFAKAVALPELPQTANDQNTQVLEPFTLGSCKIDEKTQLTAAIKGGSTIFRGGRQTFTLQPVEGSATREWEFQFKNGDVTAVIARLNATGEKLDFQWTEEGVKQAATARLLCNCAVELSVAGFQHTFNLRQPANGPPLAISIEKGGGTGRWVFDHVPDIKQVFIEATRFDGLRRHVVEPPEPVNPGGDLTVWTGPKDDALFLGLKFDSSTMAKGVKMSVAVLVKSEGIERPLTYNKKEVANRIAQMNQERTVLSSQLQEASKPPPPGVDRAKLDALKTGLKQEIDLRTKRIGQVEAVSKYVADVQGAVAVHFRIYYQADDRQVDLFIAGDPPPPPKAVRRPPPPKAAEANK